MKEVLYDSGYIDQVSKFAKGGRVNFKGGGCTTKGMNKKVYGKNS